MAKKERLSEFNRGNILSAAKALFHEKGIAQTTVDDIAKKAEYSKSTVYVYFTSKEDIYNHLLFEHMQLLRDMIVEALRESPEFPGGYFAICDAMAKFYETNPFYFDGLLDGIELPQGESESVLVHIYNVGEEINGIIAEYIKRSVAEHSVPLKATPLQTSFTLWASISGIISLANKKEAYIRKAMGISKGQFMHDGFVMLFKTIKEEAGYEKQ